MSDTTIQWTDKTWNPTRGCDLVSHGCTNCYAMKQAHRFSGKGGAYEGLTKMTSHGPVWTGKVTTHPELLDAPLRWRKPQRIFVNSMSDLFHEDVPDLFIDQVFAVMALAPRHTFQILTKRPERIRRYLASTTDRRGRILGAAWSMLGRLPKYKHEGVMDRPFPLQNVHLGVSVEDQATADERIPLLLQTPAAVRYISYEPALGPVDLAVDMPDGDGPDVGTLRWIGMGSGIDWVIVGGESGPKARPFNVQWARDIIAQCKAASVPVFVKQLGARPVRDCPGGFVSSEGKRYAAIALKDRAGGDMAEWPADLRVREFPEARA